MADVKLSVSDIKKDKAIMKKLDQLPKPEQEKWLKTYVGTYNGYIKDGKSDKEAKAAAAKTAWDKVPAKLLEKPTKEHGPKKKGPLAAFKAAFLKDTDEVMKTSSAEEVAALPEDPIDGFLMWMEANNYKFAKDVEVSKEFTPEEQEFLKAVSGYSVKEEKGGFTICLHGPEGPEAGNAIEISVSEGEEDSLEEEIEEEAEEIIEEGLK